MAHLHLYMNNPTAGGVDGTEISSRDETLPLNITLDASQAENKAVKVATRCDSGYLIDGDTSIYFEGTNAAKWQVAADNNYGFGCSNYFGTYLGIQIPEIYKRTGC